MVVPQLNINIGHKETLTNSVFLTIDSIPFATAIYFQQTECAYLNKTALACLEIPEGESFNFEKWRRLNPTLIENINKINRDILFNQKVPIALQNGRNIILNCNVSIIKSASLENIFIIHFSTVSARYSISSMSALYMIKDEIKKLKPYLNNAGKYLLDNIMQKYFFNKNKSVKMSDLPFHEQEIHIIHNSFPFLSPQEVTLCCLLANNIDNNDISNLTKKSLNSIFVCVHRINKKLNVKDRHELIGKLHEVIRRNKINNRTIPFN